MRIILKTRVNKNFRDVFQAFDIKLFMKLKPPFTGLIVNRFDGCKKGDIVDISVSIPGVKQNWISEIIDNNMTENEAYFTDEGKKLPFPLKKWHHLHKIEKSIDSSIIIDDISYKTGRYIIDLAIYPFLYLMFYCRKPVYRKYFK